ncbi:MAG: T9SS type A sorting domain-containing protein [Bacteroidetes bacterium]|nr:T9SS type A sorting domain-containing protein [Bacteroidota bacterium]
MKHLLLFLGLLLSGSLMAQMTWTNPSFEGSPPGSSIPPPSWPGCQGSPDTQPGCWGVTLAPAHGVSYLGMVFLVSSPGTQESTGQTLPVAMVAGTPYAINFKLANLAIYNVNWNGGAIVNIYGGASNCAFTQLLWTSGNFTHSGWQTYNAVFTPTSSWSRFVIRVHPGVGSSWPSIGMDNLLSVILPVELQQFGAQLDGNKATISWQSSQEINLDSYTVQRAGPDMDFQNIQTLPATGANGSFQQYQMEEEDLPEGLWYYRLAINDQNGEVTYSEVRQLLYSTTGENFVLKNIFPNPADIGAELFVYSLVDQQAIVRVIDVTGKVVQSEVRTLDAGENEWVLGTDKLEAAIYRVQITAGGKSVTHSLVVAH